MKAVLYWIIRAIFACLKVVLISIATLAILAVCVMLWDAWEKGVLWYLVGSLFVLMALCCLLIAAEDWSHDYEWKARGKRR